MTEDNGVSRLTTLMALRDQGHEIPEEDLPTDVPYGTRYLWDIFIELTHTRDSGMGVSGIKYSEVVAYCSIINCKLTEWEVSLVMDLDRIYIRTYNSIREQETKKPKPAKP